MTPKIALVGEAYGEQEAYLGHPFVGASGRELVSMLLDAGILPRPARRPFEPEAVRDFWLGQDAVSLHNVFNLRPENNDVLTLCTSAAGDHLDAPPLSTGRYVRREFQPELDRLSRELAEAAPNIVVALGGTASWALLGEGGISRIRGAVAQADEGVASVRAVPRFREVDAVESYGQCRSSNSSVREGSQQSVALKVLPTYHPAAVLRDWSLRAITILDLAKAGREAAFPEVRRPRRALYLEPTLAEMEDFWLQHLSVAERIAVDIETQGTHITCIAFAPSPWLSLVVPFRDMRQRGWSYWPDARQEIAAWGFVRKVCTSGIPLIFQNGLYDVHYLWKQAGIPTPVDEDTMLMHHALYPELQKGLGFLGSCYTSEASWKLMNSKTKSWKKDE